MASPARPRTGATCSTETGSELPCIYIQIYTISSCSTGTFNSFVLSQISVLQIQGLSQHWCDPCYILAQPSGDILTVVLMHCFSALPSNGSLSSFPFPALVPAAQWGHRATTAWHFASVLHRRQDCNGLTSTGCGTPLRPVGNWTILLRKSASYKKH